MWGGGGDSELHYLHCLNLAVQDNMTVQWEGSLHIQYSKESMHYEPYDQTILLEQSAVA